MREKVLGHFLFRCFSFSLSSLSLSLSFYGLWLSSGALITLCRSTFLGFVWIVRCFKMSWLNKGPKRGTNTEKTQLGNAAAANLWFPSWGTNLASPFVLFKWMDTMVDIVSSEHINSRHLSTLHRRQWRLWMWIFGKQAGSFHIRKKTSVQFLCLFLCYFSHSSILRIQCAYWSETASCKMPLFPSKTNYRCLPLNANT